MTEVLGGVFGGEGRRPAPPSVRLYWVHLCSGFACLVGRGSMNISQYLFHLRPPFLGFSVRPRSWSEDYAEIIEACFQQVDNF